MLIIRLFHLFAIANTHTVLLKSNGKEGGNVFCPGEPIIVTCSVRSNSLRWSIGRTSFVIPEKETITFFARPNREGIHSYMNTAIGRLHFYQNTTHVASTAARSSIDSELHMHLNDANDFVEVTCNELYHNTKTINITVFPGMLYFCVS